MPPCRGTVRIALWMTTTAQTRAMIFVLCFLLFGALIAAQHYRDSLPVRTGLAVFGAAVMGRILRMLWKRKRDPSA